MWKIIIIHNREQSTLTRSINCWSQCFILTIKDNWWLQNFPIIISGLFSTDSSPLHPEAELTHRHPYLLWYLVSTRRSSAIPGTRPTQITASKLMCVHECVCMCEMQRERERVGVCECVLVDINGLNVLNTLCAQLTLFISTCALMTSPTHPNLTRFAVASQIS